MPFSTITPVGRIVQGNPLVGNQVKDDHGALVFNQDGTPKLSYYMGLAISKQDPAAQQLIAKIDAESRPKYNRFKVAIDIQDAGNLRAIAREFVKVVDAATEETKSTEATWADPAVVLFVNKLAGLTNAEQFTVFTQAYEACHARKSE